MGARVCRVEGHDWAKTKSENKCEEKTCLFSRCVIICERACMRTMQTGKQTVRVRDALSTVEGFGQIELILCILYLSICQISLQL